MSSGRTLFLSLALLAGSALAGQLAPQDPQKVKRAEELVQALAADNYAARSNAKSQLMQLGRPAIEPLEAAAVSHDPELQIRATEILIDLRGRGFLGVGLAEEEGTATDAAGNDLPPVVIASQIVNYMQYANLGVTRPFPAEVAGIQQGDKILAVNERPVHGVNDLKREVTIVGPGRVASLLIERDGKRRRLSAVLTRNPTTGSGRVQAFEPGVVNEPLPVVDLEKEYYAQDQSAAPQADPIPGAKAEIEKLRRQIREGHNDAVAMAKTQARIGELENQAKALVTDALGKGSADAATREAAAVVKDLQDLQTLLSQLRKP